MTKIQRESIVLGIGLLIAIWSVYFAIVWWSFMPILVALSLSIILVVWLDVQEGNDERKQ